VRFEVSRVMDTIERRLTTDVTLAQAVVDIGEIARYVELDGGRPVNLIRIGMAVDALSRYLVDAGAMLYPVAGRELLSEAAFTSKERMVLGRWTDDGLIEATPGVADRVIEIADFTGLPVIALRPYHEYVERFPWLRDSPERLLKLTPRDGRATLSPADAAEVDPELARAVAIGKATVPSTEDTDTDSTGTGDIFAARGAERLSHTLLVRLRFTRATPSSLGASLMARQWRCPEPECPSFSDFRRIGQPVPRLRQGVPACPRHGVPLEDIGPRPAAYAVSVVVDDLARQRFVVTEGAPVVVGCEQPEPDDRSRISVAEWTHEASAAWIGPTHVRLEVADGHLTVTDVSPNGTVIWRRSSADAAGETTSLYGGSYTLGEWDSVELYTGIELVRAGNRHPTTIGRAEPGSVLVDAPTAALRQLGVG